MIIRIVENLLGFWLFFISKSNTAGYKFYASIPVLSGKNRVKTLISPPAPTPNIAEMI